MHRVARHRLRIVWRRHRHQRGERSYRSCADARGWPTDPQSIGAELKRISGGSNGGGDLWDVETDEREKLGLLTMLPGDVEPTGETGKETIVLQ